MGILKSAGLILLFLLGSATLMFGQKKTNYDPVKFFLDKKLTVYNRNASLTGDQKAVRLDAGSSEGLAWLSGVSFSNGTIEVDLRGKDVLQQSFIGVAFHGTNDSTFDVIYFRPFNFLSDDPVRKIHAVQYVSHPDYDWKKLRDEHNGVYEKGLISPPDPNGWFHARIVVSGKSVNVFVNDDKAPSLTVEKLNDRTEGQIGLWVGDGSDGEFKNFSITAVP